MSDTMNKPAGKAAAVTVVAGGGAVGPESDAHIRRPSLDHNQEILPPLDAMNETGGKAAAVVTAAVAAAEEGALALTPADEARIRRAMRQLRLSGRRLVRSDTGWKVMTHGSAVGQLTAEEVALLAADGRLVEAEGGGMVLCAADMIEATCSPDTPASGEWVFGVAGSMRGPYIGRGFEKLARQALRGEGPMSLREAAAGVRLIEDAELAGKTRGLTMDWNAVASDRQARGPSRGGMTNAALAAMRRLAGLRAAIGMGAFALAWAACVERATLQALAERGDVSPKTVRRRLCTALAAIADAYDA